MKKYIYMAVAAIAALSSCSSDNEIISETEIGNRVLTFSATMEGNATRATLDGNENCALWDANDQININGVTYNAQAAGATTTFKAATSGVEAAGSTFTAYFPASLYDGSTATLPATQTYTAGKFDMPMYAESTNTTLAFKNLCAVLAVKVTSADIATLKSIKVKADKALSGAFTVSEDKAVLSNTSDNTKTVELVSSSALTLDATGTTFYIAIPAQNYKYLNIYLSADGSTYKEAMATKKAAGLGDIARSSMYNINYEKNAVQLWADGPYFATMNIGATSVTDYGCYYSWGGSVNLAGTTGTPTYNTGTSELTGDDDTATKLWGINWRMPTDSQLKDLANENSNDYCVLAWQSTGVNGYTFTGKGDYASNFVFLPAAGNVNGRTGTVSSAGRRGNYWSSTPNADSASYAHYLEFSSGGANVDFYSRGNSYSVRAVLAE